MAPSFHRQDAAGPGIFRADPRLGPSARDWRAGQACSPPGVVALPPMKWSRAPISLVPVADRRAVRSGDNVVQVVGWLIGWLQTILNAPLYLWQAWIAARFNRSRPWLYFNYIYQLEWVILVAVFVCLWSPRHWIVATIVDSHKRRRRSTRGYHHCDFSGRSEQASPWASTPPWSTCSSTTSFRRKSAQVHKSASCLKWRQPRIAMSTALDNGQRSPRKLLRAVVAQPGFADRPLSQRSRARVGLRLATLGCNAPSRSGDL
jgi:hypothetical protein